MVLLYRLDMSNTVFIVFFQFGRKFILDFWITFRFNERSNTVGLASQPCEISLEIQKYLILFRSFKNKGFYKVDSIRFNRKNLVITDNNVEITGTGKVNKVHSSGQLFRSLENAGSFAIKLYRIIRIHGLAQIMS